MGMGGLLGSSDIGGSFPLQEEEQRYLLPTPGRLIRLRMTQTRQYAAGELFTRRHSEGSLGLSFQEVTSYTSSIGHGSNSSMLTFRDKDVYFYSVGHQVDSSLFEQA
jgi:hypothetical protein